MVSTNLVLFVDSLRGHDRHSLQQVLSDTLRSSVRSQLESLWDLGDVELCLSRAPQTELQRSPLAQRQAMTADLPSAPEKRRNTMSFVENDIGATCHVATLHQVRNLLKAVGVKPQHVTSSCSFVLNTLVAVALGAPLELLQMLLRNDTTLTEPDTTVCLHELGLLSAQGTGSVITAESVAQARTTLLACPSTTTDTLSTATTTSDSPFQLRWRMCGGQRTLQIISPLALLAWAIQLYHRESVLPIATTTTGGRPLRHLDSRSIASQQQQGLHSSSSARQGGSSGAVVVAVSPPQKASPLKSFVPLLSTGSGATQSGGFVGIDPVSAGSFSLPSSALATPPSNKDEIITATSPKSPAASLAPAHANTPPPPPPPPAVVVCPFTQLIDRVQFMLLQQRRRTPLIVFLGGTSGCGKSTLAALVAQRLGISTIISTDGIREILRGKREESVFPELFVSTYEAHLAGASSSASPISSNGSMSHPFGGIASSNSSGLSAWRMSPSQASFESVTASASSSSGAATTSRGTIASSSSLAAVPEVAAFIRQARMVLEVLDKVIDRYVERGESLVVEGVHLLPSYCVHRAGQLNAASVQSPSSKCCTARPVPVYVPLVVQIDNLKKHLSRFAIRAKAMTLKPTQNRYVKNFNTIRRIQEYLVAEAKELDLLRINNTNVDKSVSLLHAYLLKCVDCWAQDAPNKTNLCYVPTTHLASPLAQVKGKQVVHLLMRRREEKRTRRARSADAPPQRSIALMSFGNVSPSSAVGSALTNPNQTATPTTQLISMLSDAPLFPAAILSPNESAGLTTATAAGITSPPMAPVSRGRSPATMHGPLDNAVGVGGQQTRGTAALRSYSADAVDERLRRSRGVDDSAHDDDATDDAEGDGSDAEVNHSSSGAHDEGNSGAEEDAPSLMGS